MKRPTIHDIARRAGVSNTAVSFALNGKPGISDTTRRRIIDVAAELGWRPSSAARALVGSRAGAVGLVLARKPSLLAAEPYYMQLIAGFEEVLGPAGIGLMLHVVGEHPEHELEAYRRWWGQRQVDGVFVGDLRSTDPRIKVLQDLGLPAVVMTSSPQPMALPTVWQDIRASVHQAVRYLTGLGHRDIGRVAGPQEFVHTQDRTRAFEEAIADGGVRDAPIAYADTYADYNAEGGDLATRQLLGRPNRPTAIIYDNDVMAVRGVAVAQRLGLRVPAELSVLAWDDSPLCDLLNPAVSSMHVDLRRFGALTAGTLLRVIEGESVGQVPYGVLSVNERASTAPPTR